MLEEGTAYVNIEQRKVMSTQTKAVVQVKKSKSIMSKAIPYFYLLPCLIILLTFVYYPFLKTIYLSFSLTNMKGVAVEFVGLENYQLLFKSKEFYNSLKVTIQFVLMVVPLSIGGGLILAVLANQKMRTRRLCEVMFSLPMAIASAPAAIIWSILYNPTNGWFNYILQTNKGWLTDPQYALVAVALVTVWLNLGINFIFLLAGLKNIEEELLESAAVDGANRIQRLSKITLPLLSPQIFFVLLMNIIVGFQTFAQIRLLTQGGPGNATNVLVHSIYREAFFNGRFEMAAAQSIILFGVMLGITLLQFKFENRGVHYQ